VVVKGEPARLCAALVEHAGVLSKFLVHRKCKAAYGLGAGARMYYTGESVKQNEEMTANAGDDDRGRPRGRAGT
jgi:hypothetical protein